METLPPATRVPRPLSLCPVLHEYVALPVRHYRGDKRPGPHARDTLIDNNWHLAVASRQTSIRQRHGPSVTPTPPELEFAT